MTTEPRFPPLDFKVEKTSSETNDTYTVTPIEEGVVYYGHRGELRFFDNKSQIWITPEMNTAPEQIDGMTFGIILAWLIVLMAFLSDFCWGNANGGE